MSLLPLSEIFNRRERIEGKVGGNIGVLRGKTSPVCETTLYFFRLGLGLGLNFPRAQFVAKNISEA